MSELEKEVWWKYLDEGVRELLKQSELLSVVAQSWHKNLPEEKQEFHDYAFVIFPAAKAYEGFLKKLFLDLGFITEADYRGKLFRIGRALNPSLEDNLRAESIYDRLVEKSGKDLPNKLWDTWKQARNLTFHWFPDEKNAISLDEAKQRFGQITDSINSAFATFAGNLTK